MLGKSLVIFTLITAALFSWVLLGSLKQDNCINSNTIRNIIIFDGKSQKKVNHCNDLKFSTEHYDYSEIKLIKAVNSLSKHWFFESKRTPYKFPIRKPKYTSSKKIEAQVLDQLLHFNFFRSKPITWIEKSYLLFLKKIMLDEKSDLKKLTDYLQAASHCDGCQHKVIENLADAPKEFHQALAQYISEYLFKSYQESSLKQKLMFDYFIKRGDLASSLNTIKALAIKDSFLKLNLASQIKTITTWMRFYSQQQSQVVLNLDLSQELLPTAYEFNTSLPLSWQDFLPINSTKAQIKINNKNYDLIKGWVFNLNQKVSRNKQVFLFQCTYPKLKKAMQYLYNTPKLVFVKICNIQQLLKVLKSMDESKGKLQLAKLNFKYVEYNLSSLKIIEKKLHQNFLLKPQNLSSILYWQELIQDPVTKITQPKAAIDGVISFRN